MRNSNRNSSAPANPEDEIQAALGLLDQLETVASDLPARREFAALLRKLNLWLGLEFTEGLKGKKRRVQKLVRGVITFDENDLPVPPFGKDYVDDNEDGNTKPIATQGQEKSENKEKASPGEDKDRRKESPQRRGRTCRKPTKGHFDHKGESGRWPLLC